MTFLQAINKVLRRLREKQVTVLTADYTALVAEYVNEAKEEVESAWKWKALRTKVTFNTVAGQVEYNLGTGGVGSTATNERSYLLMNDETGLPLVFNETDDDQMTEWPLAAIQEYRSQELASNQKPSTFALTRSATGITMVMYPPPDGAYSMAAYFVIPQAELTATTDVIRVPSEPVWRLALAMAEEERGTGLGARAEVLMAKAKGCLADYIMRDAEEFEMMIRAV